VVFDYFDHRSIHLNSCFQNTSFKDLKDSPFGLWPFHIQALMVGLRTERQAGACCAQ
jgi:hypothetical protein